MTELEVITVIDNVANRLARRFRFGYHSLEDMKQQARLFAWEGLIDYNGLYPLENYLWTHVRNRLCNYKRDNYIRPDSPCSLCGKIEHCQNRLICEKYMLWQKKQSAKINVVSPMMLDNVNGCGEAHMSDDTNILNDVLIGELLEIIDRDLPITMRGDFIKLQRGLKIAKHRKVKLQWTLQTILLNNGYTEEARKIKSN